MPYQVSLDIDAETFTQREKLIIKRLGEYRTVDADIRRQQRIIKGELTNCLPSVTIQPMDEDDIGVIASLKEQPSEGILQIARVVGQYVDLSDARYANRVRVAKRLRDTFSDDAEEDQALQDAYVILTERGEEEGVHLTPAERYAHDREREVERAEGELVRLTNLKRSVGYALADLVDYCEEWHTILWYRFVMGESMPKVQMRAARDGVPLTRDEYLGARKKALVQFDKWAVGLR